MCRRSHVDEGHKSVMCQKCNQWTHQSCANLNNQEMKALEKGRHNITWFCNACTADEVVKLLKGIPTHSTDRYRQCVFTRSGIEA